MRIADFTLAVVVVVGLSGTARAQAPSAPPVPVNPATVSTYDPSEDHWIASAFVGSNFGSGRGAEFDTVDNQTSLNFGGQVGYLWRGVVGAEVLADFSPSFEINSILLEDNPHIYTYMANGIAAVPIGDHNQFLPYFSGGVGAVLVFAERAPLGHHHPGRIEVVGGDTAAAVSVAAVLQRQIDELRR